MKPFKPCMIAICGVKNSGKTTVMEQLIALLSQKGIKIAAIKHDGHDFEGDAKGTDSWRHFRAGAFASVVYSNTKASIVRREEKPRLEDIAALFPDVDLILCEGQKNAEMPKIEVVRNEISDRPYCSEDEVLAYVTDLPLCVSVPVYRFEELEAVAELIYERFLLTKEEKNVILK